MNRVIGQASTITSLAVRLFLSLEELFRESRYSTRIAQQIPIIKYSRSLCNIKELIVLRVRGWVRFF